MQLSDTQWYQGILTSLNRLDKLVVLTPQEFADEHLKRIESELDDLVEAVEEGVI